MNYKKYIFPLFISSQIIGQEESTIFPKIQIGFCHSTYTSFNFKSNPHSFPILNNDKKNNFADQKITEIQYGFGIGFFLWMPLNKAVVFKPKLEGFFSNSYLKERQSIYATCFDVSLSHSFAVALKPINENGTIGIAKNMSCYLASKQPYLIIGPKINLKKFDSGYIHKGFQN